MLKVIFALLNILFVAKSSGVVWGYNDQGKDWEMGSCKDNAVEQSPINVFSMPTVDNDLSGEVEVTGGPVTAEFVNNGHTV